MPRTPLRFHGPAQVSGSAATKFTVPGATKYVIKYIHVQNPSTSVVTFTCSIGADAAATRLFDAFSIPAKGAGVAGNVLDHFCEYTLEAGEIFQAFAGTAATLVLIVDGEAVT